MSDITLTRSKAEEITEVLRLGLEHLRNYHPEDKVDVINMNAKIRRTEDLIYHIEKDIKDSIISRAEAMSKKAERLREVEDDFSESKTNWIEGRR